MLGSGEGGLFEGNDDDARQCENSTEGGRAWLPWIYRLSVDSITGNPSQPK